MLNTKNNYHKRLMDLITSNIDYANIIYQWDNPQDSIHPVSLCDYITNITVDHYTKFVPALQKKDLQPFLKQQRYYRLEEHLRWHITKYFKYCGGKK